MGWLTTQRNETLRDKAHRKILKADICAYCRKPIKGTYGGGNTGLYHPKCAKKAAEKW